MPRTTDGLQPVNIIKGKKSFRVVFETGQQRFIAKRDLAKWQAAVDAYWAKKDDKPEPPSSSMTNPKPEGCDASKGGTMPTKKQTPAAASTSTTSTHLRLKTRAEFDYDPHDLGYVLRGVVEHARGCGPDPLDIFMPKHEVTPSETPHQAKLKEMGRELFDLLPAAVSFFNIDDKEWQSWLRRAVPVECGPARIQPADPLIGSSSVPAVLPTSEPAAAWLAPVVGPITSRFGQQRGGGELHDGIDIAVPVGTSVVAPTTLKVEKVGFSRRAGRYVVTNVMRDGGEFDDGDGYRLTFAHLSAVRVAEARSCSEVSRSGSRELRATSRVRTCTSGCNGWRTASSPTTTSPLTRLR